MQAGRVRLETSRVYALATQSARPRWVKPLSIFLVIFILSIPRALAQPAEEPAQVLPMPTLHMRLGTGDGVLRGPNGKDYVVPQGTHVLAPGAWEPLDAEMLRLQEQETRLKAENESFRKSADKFEPGWKLLVSALVIGIAGGAYVGAKYL